MYNAKNPPSQVISYIKVKGKIIRLSIIKVNARSIVVEVPERCLDEIIYVEDIYSRSYKAEEFHPHYWKNDLRLTLRMLQDDFLIPHLETEDNKLKTNCTTCAQAIEMKFKFQQALSKET